MKVGDLIHQAARNIGLIGIGENLTDAQLTDGLELLNQEIAMIMHHPLLSGLRLAEVSSKDDEAPRDRVAVKLLANSLGVVWCNSYGLDPSVAMAVKEETITWIKRKNIKALKSDAQDAGIGYSHRGGFWL